MPPKLLNKFGKRGKTPGKNITIKQPKPGKLNSSRSSITSSRESPSKTQRRKTVKSGIDLKESRSNRADNVKQLRDLAKQKKIKEARDGPEIKEARDGPEIKQMWEKFATENGKDPNSQSGFKRWKIENMNEELTRGISSEWNETILRANRITKHIASEVADFKQKPLNQGVLEIKGHGANKLGQGISHTPAHIVFTGIPGTIIAQQVIINSGITSNITVESWTGARAMMNPTAVVAQGIGVIGKPSTINSRTEIKVKSTSEIQLNYVTFTLKYPKYFGCPVSPIDIPSLDRFKQQKDGSFIYDYNTANTSFGIGRGTLFGIPADEIEYRRQKQITGMMDWLSNMPLILQSPMKKGRPHGKAEPPHTEHVLSILEALWYLNLFESSHVRIMEDYHTFMEAWFYGEPPLTKANWGRAPTSNHFLIYLRNVYENDKDESDELFLNRIWGNSDVTNIDAAWTLIQDFILEYLYANADNNYEKNDDSLIAIVDSKTGAVGFNENMALNLALRIWNNRLTPPGGLIDIIFSSKSPIVKRDMRDIWLKNITASWRQRIIPTCDYINGKLLRGGVDLYGLATISNYNHRLPNTIKEVMLGHRTDQTEDELTLVQRDVYLVPTNAMTIMVMQGLSQLIADIVLNDVTGYKISYEDFIRFCGFPEGTTVDSILRLNKNPNVRQSSRVKASDSDDLAKTKYQTISFMALFELIKNRPDFRHFLEIGFTIMYYSKTVTDIHTISGILEKDNEKALLNLKRIYVETEAYRNTVIASLVSEFYILLANFFMERLAVYGKSDIFSESVYNKLKGLIASKKEQYDLPEGLLSDVEAIITSSHDELTSQYSLYKPLYLHDEKSCRVFFGESFNSVIVKASENVSNFNYGENFVKDSVTKESEKSLVSMGKEIDEELILSASTLDRLKSGKWE